MLKKNTIAAILIFFVAGLLIGKMVDHFITNPFLNDIQNQPHYDIEQNNVSKLLHINNQTDITSTRNALVSYIWKEQGFPNYFPTKIEKNITDPSFSNIENLKQIDKIIVDMDYGVDSIVYLFHAENSNNKLVIYHQGHDGSFANGKESIKFFLQNHYSVLAFSMPLTGMNNQPVVYVENEGNIKLVSHNSLAYLDSDHFSPIRFFVEPLAISLNYIDANYGFDEYDMVGISGGGWTTTLYSAIDQRITQSYSIAGSLPLYLRNTQADMGDYEQTLPNLYRIANYLDLYTLDAYGNNRKHIQIFNKYDPCCFADPAFETYSGIIKSAINNLDGNGTFAVYVDDTHKEHKISNHALEIILKSMKE